jgi:serine/threonine-protein kinase HipA
MGGEMAGIIDDVVERTPRVIDAVGARLPKGFPERVFEVITKGMRGSAAKLGRGAEA